MKFSGLAEVALGRGAIAKTNSGPRGARWGRLTASGPSDVGTDAKPKPQILVERLSSPDPIAG